MPSITPIPTRWIGPIKFTGNAVEGMVKIPLATYETPLWPSCSRGATISRQLDAGICVTVMHSCMTRSIILRAENAPAAYAAEQQITNNQAALNAVIANTSRFAKLQDVHSEIVGNLLFLRFAFFTGDASGHNMATKASDALIKYLLEAYPALSYASISGNLCTDKKPSAVNGILGRGHYAVAEILIPKALVETRLRSSADAIATLNYRKNYVGSTLAGALRSANAHYANMLLAFYLATGQDAANIIEGSQGMNTCENRDGDLYFSCTLPNLIMGTVGNGKGGELDVVEQHLKAMGCRETREVGENSRRLAALCAGIVLCGELSLLAAQTNPGELVRAHVGIERQS